jgi:hypothetical protein
MAIEHLNLLTPELNPSAQRCLPRYLLGILIFKGFTALRLYNSFGVKGLKKLYGVNICILSVGSEVVTRVNVNRLSYWT